MLAYDARAKTSATMFMKNFARFKDIAGTGIMAASPVAQMAAEQALRRLVFDTDAK